jgi:hypothetical protein
MKLNMKTYTLDEETISRIDALRHRHEMTASALIRKVIREAYLETFALQEQISIEADSRLKI